MDGDTTKKDSEFFRVKEQWRKYQHIGDPFHWTAAIGDHIAVKEAICGLDGAKMMHRSDKADPLGWTAFTYAAASLQDGPVSVAVLRSLLNKKELGLDAHAKDICGRTALHVAAQMNNVYACAFLLRRCKLDATAGATPGPTST